MKKFFVLIIFSFLYISIIAETNDIKQNIRGRVLDIDSGFPITGANVIVPGSDPFIGAAADEHGYFLLKNVPIGKTSVRVTAIGYKEYVQNNLQLISGKEFYINIELEPTVLELEEAVVTGSGSAFAVKNEDASVSIRSFDSEQTARFAGSRNDPARMAANYAGVSGANDSRNDIIIRGNSPFGLLWRIEGIEVPNPNHFASFGSTGGPVSMLNNNVLDKSDFITAAFPADYGNALSGVFDLYIRNGSPNKSEFLGQVGFNGFEFGAEGPLPLSENSSYLANYRYSTLGAVKELGFDLGTGVAVPYYQDLNFKLNIPTESAGTFSVFGIGGISSIDLIGSETDPENENDLYGIENDNIYDKVNSGALSISQTYFLSKNTFYKIISGFSMLEESIALDSINSLDRNIITRYIDIYNKENKYILSAALQSKIDNKNVISFGADLNYLNLTLSEKQLRGGNWETIKSKTGNTNLLKLHAAYKYRMAENITFNSGLHYMYFALNGTNSIEPRLGIVYQLNTTQRVSIGYGLHSQIQPLPIYFTIDRDAFGNMIEANSNLSFTKSHHIAASYDVDLSSDLRLKTEVYYQYLFNVPVTRTPSSFSLLNYGSDFGTTDQVGLINNGKGENYGFEVTLEKIFNDDYYFLLTSSLFESKYAGSDNIWRNTAYNGKYVINLLGGKEFNLGNDVLFFDIKATYAGGRYYSPIDLAASLASGRESIIGSEAFSLQYEPYFRSDLKIGYRINSSSITQEYILEIQNVTDNKNVYRKHFNRRTGGINTEYQLGIFPVMQYRILF